MLNWIFKKIELIIYIKMDLALSTYKGWYAIKPNKPTNNTADYRMKVKKKS